MEHPPAGGLRPLNPMTRAFLFSVVVLAWLTVPVGAGEPSIDQTAGKRLYVGRCAKCHKLYDPAKYSDAQWQRWMDKMSRKAKLQPAERQVVSSYIEAALRRPEPAPLRKVCP